MRACMAASRSDSADVEISGAAAAAGPPPYPNAAGDAAHLVPAMMVVGGGHNAEPLALALKHSPQR